MAPFLGTNYYYGTTSVAALMASAGAVDSYAVGGNSPPVVADFVNEYYRVGGSDSDFATMFSGTTTRSDLATMVDSDEVIKWCPHNLLSSSEDVTALTNFRSTDGANVGTAPDGTSTASRLIEDNTASQTHGIYFNNAVVSGGERCRFVVYAKAGDRSNISLGTVSSAMNTDGVAALCLFDVSTGTKGDDQTSDTNGTITDVGGGWYRCSVDFTTVGTNVDPAIFMSTGNTTGNTTFSGDATTYANGVLIWGWHFFRVDLGGMADVPTDIRTYSSGASYVKTTTAAKYLQRRGHHIYNGSTWDNKGILLETEARTNLWQNSNNLTTSPNNVSSQTTTALDATGPDGQTSAWTVTRNTSTGTSSIAQAFTITSGVTYTASMIFKAGNISWIIGRAFGFDTDYSMSFDATNVATGSAWGATSAPPTYGVYDLGNGFVRAWFTFSTTTDVSGAIYWYLAEADADLTVDVGEYLILYAAQVEAGSTASSYIPTPAATVSRAADSLTIPAANMSASTSNMSFQIDGAITYADEGSAAQETFLRWYTDANNNIVLDLDTDSTATGEVNANQVTAGTADTVVATAEYSPGINVAFNIASRHTSGAINVAKDGTAATADTTPTALADLSSTNCAIGYDFMGTISQFRQWNVDLGDSGIETAST